MRDQFDRRSFLRRILGVAAPVGAMAALVSGCQTPGAGMTDRDPVDAAGAGR